MEKVKKIKANDMTGGKGDERRITGGLQRGRKATEKLEDKEGPG